MTEEIAARVLGFLGLCTRAGQLTFGQEGCVSAARSQKAALMLLDEGCSANTRKRLEDACKGHSIPLYHLGEDEIARAVGKGGVKVVAVSHGRMADKLLALLGEGKLVEGA